MRVGAEAACAATGKSSEAKTKRTKTDRTASGPIRMLAGLLAQFPELVEDLLLVRLFSDVMNVDVADLPILVDDEDCPFGHSLRSQNAILFRNAAVRIEIAEKRISDPSERF